VKSVVEGKADFPIARPDFSVSEQAFGPSPGPVILRCTGGHQADGVFSAIAEDGLMEINGVAHTFITAGDFAAARAFYGQLLPFLGLAVVADSVNTFYCVGGRTGFGIHGAAPEFAGQRFRQGTVGLHHHCFRARERGDVDEAYNFLVKIGAKIIHEPREDGFAPGYYSVLFEDPDGTRLEINHVPGKGLLEPGMQIGGGYADGTQNR
jgi:catechol 2,3-dioxygenase-like lactoylglutathione lyase family enzyme